jgi:hypothetical protein
MTTIINNSETVRLAREAIAWWDEQQDASLKRMLHLKEPPFIQRARKILGDAKLRYSVEPRDGRLPVKDGIIQVTNHDLR